MTRRHVYPLFYVTPPGTQITPYLENQKIENLNPAPIIVHVKHNAPEMELPKQSKEKKTLLNPIFFNSRIKILHRYSLRKADQSLPNSVC